MILARLSRAVREQNWFAVVLEFVIVIAGVVIGFQITAGAERAAEAERRAIALDRLHAEVEDTVGLLARMTELYDIQNEARTEAIERLIAHDFDGMDEAKLTFGITSIMLFPAFSPQEGVYTEIVSSGMLSSLGDEAFRDALGAYQSEANFLKGQIDYLRAVAVAEGRLSSFDPFRIEYAPGTSREIRNVLDWGAASEDPDFMDRLIIGNNSMRAMADWWRDTLESALVLCAETSRLTGQSCDPPERTFE
ncbi:MAG: hypothetical protein GC188_10050 [Alphaproteobacteria bacterium]|nr:hypothetical protein [Alphaproteobacteria bacterium]